MAKALAQGPAHQSPDSVSGINSPSGVSSDVTHLCDPHSLHQVFFFPVVNIVRVVVIVVLVMVVVTVVSVKVVVAVVSVKVSASVCRSPLLQPACVW